MSILFARARLGIFSWMYPLIKRILLAKTFCPVPFNNFIVCRRCEMVGGLDNLWKKSQKGRFRSVRTSGDVENWRSFVPIRSRTQRQNTYHLVHRPNSQMYDFGRESRSKVRNKQSDQPQWLWVWCYSGFKWMQLKKFLLNTPRFDTPRSSVFNTN